MDRLAAPKLAVRRDHSVTVITQHTAIIDVEGIQTLAKHAPERASERDAINGQASADRKSWHERVLDDSDPVDQLSE